MNFEDDKLYQLDEDRYLKQQEESRMHPDPYLGYYRNDKLFDDNVSPAYCYVDGKFIPLLNKNNHRKASITVDNFNTLVALNPYIVTTIDENVNINYTGNIIGHLKTFNFNFNALIAIPYFKIKKENNSIRFDARLILTANPGPWNSYKFESVTDENSVELYRDVEVQHNVGGHSVNGVNGVEVRCIVDVKYESMNGKNVDTSVEMFTVLCLDWLNVAPDEMEIVGTGDADIYASNVPNSIYTYRPRTSTLTEDTRIRNLIELKNFRKTLKYVRINTNPFDLNNYK